MPKGRLLSALPAINQGGKMKKNIIIGQSGGPTAVINGSLYGAVTKGLQHSESIGRVYGMINGIEGFLLGNYMDMSELADDDSLERLRVTPGAYLGSCRYKLPEDLGDPVYPQIFEKFQELDIEYFFYIGGNDSMDTVSKLSRYAKTVNSPLRVIGIPKTIDNDLIKTDHTPGFGSAAKYVATMVREMSLDVSGYKNTPSITIVEIMGRHAGWLTGASALARKHKNDNPLLIYLPETVFDIDTFFAQAKKALAITPNVLVCISEGIRDADGKFICEYSGATGTDTFGHKELAGAGKYLENLIRSKFGIKVRSVELNICQRCSSSCLSATDLQEAIQAGAFAVEAALAGETGKMVTFVRESDTPYALSFSLSDVNEICNAEKKVPLDWITPDGCDVTEAFLTYARPLIQGEEEVPHKDGLPDFIYR